MIFGGTSEGREIAAYAADIGCRAYVYVATKTGEDFLEGLTVDVHVGRLDAEAMAEEIRRTSPVCVLDATHPYAAEATENIRTAAAGTGCGYYRILRETAEQKGDHEVADAAEAAELLQKEYADVPVLLTTGSKELSEFRKVIAENPGVYSRILNGEENVEKALSAGLLRDHILEGCGPFSGEENLRVLKMYAIRVLVTKESGVRGGYEEKLRAAKRAGCRVIVIRRPGNETGITPEEAQTLLRGIVSGNM